MKKMVSWREHLHAHPELSFQEVNTSAFVASTLEELGIPYQHGIAGTGVVALIKGQNPEKHCVALRADLDALPIHEENEVPYKSKKQGVMHACGHDVHTTCLLGAAIVLNQFKNQFEGTIKLIFQPGEERLPGGASMMINEGVLQNPKVDKILALHVYPSMDVGKVGFKPGLYMAACDELYLTIKGIGGHAALPNAYNNPVMLISKLLPKLESYLESLSDSTSPFVFAFGKLEAEGATNVIPEFAKASGTLRTMDEQWRSNIHKKLKVFVADFLTSNNAEGQLEIIKGYPCLNNDEILTENCIQSANEYLGSENVELLDVRMTAEDFSFFSQKIPACFFRLGVRNEDLGIIYGVHHPKFDVDKNAIKYGAGLMAYSALKSFD
ncbi:MAG: N-acyl-L-amino acid amidohydrolase [Bacteroidetes bacterium MED-G21]|nr:MAG: N-acyl-L-amino acid amidohydrolase [Bacteroidetes bacterium MED-G21]